MYTSKTVHIERARVVSFTVHVPEEITGGFLMPSVASFPYSVNEIARLRVDTKIDSE